MSRWTIKPALGSVLVKPLNDETVTKSGLIIIGATERETHVCEIVELCDPYESAVDDRTFQRAGPIHALGAIVLIGKYNGRDVVLTNSEGKRDRYIIIRESDVLGTLEERDVEQPVS